MLLQHVAVAILGFAAFTDAVSIREEARLLRRQNRNGGNFGNTGNTGNFQNSANGNNNAATNKAAASNKNDKAATSSKASSNAGAAATCLSANAIQIGSFSDGQNPPVAGQAASATYVKEIMFSALNLETNDAFRDAANFVNFCAGETLTNGLQVKGGSCNGIGKKT